MAKREWFLVVAYSMPSIFRNNNIINVYQNKMDSTAACPVRFFLAGTG
jgi:hypothetical protein